MDLITASSTLPQISPEDRAALTDAKSSLIGDVLTRPLATDVRQRLQTFVGAANRLAAMLATDPQIETEIAGLMVCFRSNRAISAGEAQATVREYREVLNGLPLWAIKEGFRRVKSGEVDDVSLDFPPSAPRLKTVIDEVMRPMLADRYTAKTVLAARIAPPENQQMADRVERLTKADLLKKYGPNFGIGGMPANEIRKLRDEPALMRSTMTMEQVLKHYQSHGLAFKPKAKSDGDRSGDASVDPQHGGYLQAGE